MSPERGGRKAPGRGKKGAAASSRPVDRTAARRLGLFAFGAAFVLLFAIVAIAQGIGDPDIPEGDVILVEEVPGDGGTISKADFDHALELAAAQAGQKKVPKPGNPQYAELKESALNSLIEFAWLEGEAAEMGIEVSDREIAKELKKLKDESFQNEAEFNKFVKEAKFTQEDIDQRVKFQIISEKIQQQLAEEPKPSSGEVENYYEAAKATQFTQPASRDIRLIRNEDRAEAQKALAALQKDNTAKSWNQVAKKFSEDQATKGNGGLQRGATEASLEEPLGSAVFDAQEGQLEGPLKTPQGFVVFEVQSANPEKVQELSEVEQQIEGQLSQQAQQESFNAFVADFNQKWTSRTHCAEGYVTERCDDFQGDARPAAAPPGCYEEDPQGGRPEACPAPVFQLVPAMPGSVTPLAPQGNPLAQRPKPAGGEEGGAGAGGEIPGGFAPPPGE